MPTPPVQKNEVLAQLGIKKGSRIGPLLLLLIVVILLFIVLSLPSGLKELVQNLDLKVQEPLDFEKVYEAAKAQQEAVERKLAKAWENKEYWSFFGQQLILPAAKGYLTELFKDFITISRNLFHTTWQLLLYSLIPGIAGLIYRRNFWAWFLASFVILFVINESAILGKVASGDGKMPLSGSILIFVVSQIALLLLANRLRRHSSSVSMIPAWIYNGVLAAILLFVGLAYASSWSPWVDPKTKVGMIWSFLPTGFYKWEIILVGLPVLYFLFRKSVRWNDRSRKNIVVCLDGTSNTPDQYELGLLAQTNVFKLFKMLKSDGPASFVPGTFDASLCKRYGNRQIAFYYTGVGNKFENDPIAQLLGMASGVGGSGIVERAYLDIMRVYRPGDRIFVFGFSRGAAIARLLARAIDNRDAPRTMLTIRLFGRHWRLWKSGHKQHQVPISVLGCWDTVGSFGIAKTIAGINFQQINLFKDLTVPDNVEQAYHMLALDEARDSFEPSLMEPDPITPERIVEVWFSGDHANVGGGWATDKLSDVTLDFLLRHVSSGYASHNSMEPGDESWGLYLKAANAKEVDPSRYGDAALLQPDPLGQLRSWTSMLYKYRPRKLPLHAVISETVFQRMRTAMPVYAPDSLFNLNEELDKKRDTIDTALKRLLETQSLNQEEHADILRFKDKLALTRWPQYSEELNRSRATPTRENVLSNETYAMV